MLDIVGNIGRGSFPTKLLITEVLGSRAHSRCCFAVEGFSHACLRGTDHADIHSTSLHGAIDEAGYKRPLGCHEEVL